MEFEQVVMGRQSVRGYKKDPVPKEVIADIINVAKRAPSSMNTQPWHIHALTGAALDEVRSRNMTEMSAGAKPKRDIPSHGAYEGKHRFRQVEIAKKLFAAMGIAREDAERRQDWVLRGFRQFDAPVSLVLTYDRDIDGAGETRFDLAHCVMASSWQPGIAALVLSSMVKALCVRTSCAKWLTSLKKK